MNNLDFSGNFQIMMSLLHASELKGFVEDTRNSCWPSHNESTIVKLCNNNCRTIGLNKA